MDCLYFSCAACTNQDVQAREDAAGEVCYLCEACRSIMSTWPPGAAAQQMMIVRMGGGAAQIRKMLSDQLPERLKVHAERAGQESIGGEKP